MREVILAYHAGGWQLLTGTSIARALAQGTTTLVSPCHAVMIRQITPRTKPVFLQSWSQISFK